MSLARQFALAGGTVMLLATIGVGVFVAQRIEDAVVRNTANATALYMESVIAPVTQELAAQERLPDASLARLRELIDGTVLGQRVVSYKIWRAGGLVVAASNPALVGRVFEPTENLRKAWGGHVQAEFADTNDEEDRAEKALGVPLLEIYSPIRELSSGTVIAVVEFYEAAKALQSDLVRARASSWGMVAALMAIIWLSMFAIVLRGSRTIDRQVMALKDLAARNVALRQRVQGAAGRFSATNEQALRQIGADLHDGPAQLVGFAALRLDALKAQVPASAREDMEAVSRAVAESLVEIRDIARGLVLPDIERRPLGAVLRGLAEAHTSRTGARVEVMIADDLPEDIPLAVKICLFRAAQEGLSNGWRHGGGAMQDLRLTADRTVLELIVGDAGPGFTTHPPVPEAGDVRLGLAGLANRVEALGGRMEVRNRPAGGAELCVVLDSRTDE